MWTWHWTGRRTRPVLLYITTQGTQTTAMNGHTCCKRLTVLTPTQQQTRGGRSTSEWRCTSWASNSQIEEIVVVRTFFLQQWLNQLCYLSISDVNNNVVVVFWLVTGFFRQFHCLLGRPEQQFRKALCFTTGYFFIYFATGSPSSLGRSPWFPWNLATWWVYGCAL